jgi:hypothetical protein
MKWPAAFGKSFEKVKLQERHAECLERVAKEKSAKAQSDGLERAAKVKSQPHNDRCHHEQYDQKQGAKAISSALRRCFAPNIFVSYQVCPDSGSSGTKTGNYAHKKKRQRR